MLVNNPSPRKISDSYCIGLLALKHLRKAIMTSILIVEDDVLTNEYLEFILQQAGYEVVSATSQRFHGIDTATPEQASNSTMRVEAG